MFGRYLVLFAIIFTGWVIRKIGFIDGTMNHGINKLIVYFAYPCMIVHNIGTIDMTSDVVRDFMIAFVLSAFLMYLYGIVGRGYAHLFRFPREDSPVYEGTMMFPNDGFMGFSMALLFFGEKGLMLMLAHNAALNVVLFTYGTSNLNRNSVYRKKFSVRTVGRAFLRLLVNPNIIALAIGFAVALSPVTLPVPVDEYLVYLGSISTPMAMFYIGSTLSTCEAREVVSDKYTFEACGYKLIVTVVMTALIVFFLPIDPLIKAIMVLGTAFPTATTVCMLTEQAGLNEKAATRMMFMSTVLSIPTIPIVVKLINMLIM